MRGDDNESNSFASSDDFTFDGIEEEESRSPQFVKRDSANVRISLFVVLGMLSITASLVVTMTYIFLSDAEEDEFANSVSICKLAALHGYPIVLVANNFPPKR